MKLSGGFYTWHEIPTKSSGYVTHYETRLYDGRFGVLRIGGPFHVAEIKDTLLGAPIWYQAYNHPKEAEEAIAMRDAAHPSFNGQFAGILKAISQTPSFIHPPTVFGAPTIAALYVWRKGRNTNEHVTQMDDGRTAVIMEDNGFMDTEYHVAIDGDYLGIGYASWRAAEEAIRDADAGRAKVDTGYRWGAPRCECGSTKAGDVYHARWCPVYVDPMTGKKG